MFAIKRCVNSLRNTSEHTEHAISMRKPGPEDTCFVASSKFRMRVESLYSLLAVARRKKQAQEECVL